MAPIHLSLSRVTHNALFTIIIILIRFFTVAIIFIIIGVLGFGYYYDHHFYQHTQNTTIIIPKGASLTKITDILYQNGVIKYPEIFKILRRFDKRTNKLHYGQYVIKTKMTPYDITQLLYDNKVVDHLFIAYAGKTSFETIEALNNNPLLSGDMIEQNIPDGAILPESYHYHYGDDRHDLLQRMIDAMHKTSIEIWQKRADDIHITSRTELIILASIIEKETGLANERGLVSSVFHNRLKRNMRLQSDPTVIYAITEGKKPFTRQLTKKDLKYQSPYNLYLNHGLPPTAIANPSTESLEATANPEKSDFLFFVADNKGGHFFAKNYKQHRENVKRYRQLRK